MVLQKLSYVLTRHFRGIDNMVDLDDVLTYPDCIREWVIDKREFFLRVIPIGSYNFDYIISDTGEKCGDVLPENILKIEHIENYEEIMSQCPEFHNFYN